MFPFTRIHIKLGKIKRKQFSKNKTKKTKPFNKATWNN